MWDALDEGESNSAAAAPANDHAAAPPIDRPQSGFDMAAELESRCVATRTRTQQLQAATLVRSSAHVQAGAG